MYHVTVQMALPEEAHLALDILHEAAQWLVASGQKMWRDEELASSAIHTETAEGRFYLAWVDGEPAGCFRLDNEDTLFWPEFSPDEALYLHRLAVRRRFAGRGLSDLMLRSAKTLTCQQHRPFLRLDCELGREKLYTLYQRNGFTPHSEKLAGPYQVLRWEHRVLQT